MQKTNRPLHGLDLTCEGAIEKLLAFHRGYFGDATMSVTSASADGGTEESGETGEQSFTPITSQADLDRVISSRLARERQKYADYDELKAKAEKYDANLQKDMSDLERAEQRAMELERELEAQRLTAERATVAAEKGVPAALLAGTTRDELMASAEAAIRWRAENIRMPQSKDHHPGSSGGQSKGGSLDDGRSAFQRRHAPRSNS